MSRVEINDPAGEQRLREATEKYQRECADAVRKQQEADAELARDVRAVIADLEGVGPGTSVEELLRRQCRAYALMLRHGFRQLLERDDADRF